VEYRLAGQWYEARKAHHGFEFLDAVDEAIDRIVTLPRSGSPAPRMPADLPVKTMAVTRFPYHVVYLEMNDPLRAAFIASPSSPRRRRTDGRSPTNPKAQTTWVAVRRDDSAWRG
jgi:hypothetical protein